MAQPAVPSPFPAPRCPGRPCSESGAMEATGVLPFVRGVDLSGNDFKVSRTGGGLGSPPSCLFRSCPSRSLLPVLSASGHSD